MGHILPNPKAVKLVPCELFRTLSIRQVLHADFVGKAEELAGNLHLFGKAVCSFLGQQVPDDDQKFARNGNNSLRTA